MSQQDQPDKGTAPERAAAAGRADEGATPPAEPELAGSGTGGERRGRRRWLLIASLALNLLVLGTGAGFALKEALDGPRPMRIRELDFGPFTRALDPEDRAELRRAFFDRLGEHHGEGGRPGGLSRLALEADRAAVLAALRADPFDPAALAAVFAAQRERMIGRMELGQDLLLERIAGMPEPRRLDLADRLERGMREPRDRHGPKGD